MGGLLLAHLSIRETEILNLSTVQIEDAVVAIYLLEESLWTRHEVGLIGRFEPSDPADPVEVDKDVYVEMADCFKFAAFQYKLLDLLI